MLRDLCFCRRMRIKILSVTAATLLALAPAIGAGGLSVSQETSGAQLNTLSDAEKKEGWKLLFDGKTFNGWRSYFETMDPSKGWSIEAGCFKNSKGNGRPRSGGGEIMTAEMFTDFDFPFQWGMPPVGNSGGYYLFQARHGTPGVGMGMRARARSPR